MPKLIPSPTLAPRQHVAVVVAPDGGMMSWTWAATVAGAIAHLVQGYPGLWQLAVAQGYTVRSGEIATMTEAEAKTKWCPMTPHGPLYASQKCIGSACMMWRWHTTTTRQYNLDCPELSPQLISLPKEAWHGHCGLAGKP